MVIESKRVAVLGDLGVDRYTFGSVKRVSPEAPVLVLNPTKEEVRPGMAGNAILNLVSLGQRVIAFGRVGRGESELQLTLQAEGVDASGIVEQDHYATPIKSRFVSSNHQLLRVDYEQVTPLTDSVKTTLIDRLEAYLPTADTLAISDYGKGVCDPDVLACAIKIAKRHSIPVVTDPKGRDFARYAGTTLIKPNLHEAIDASGLTEHHTLEEVAEALMEQIESDYLMITRSENGISLFSRCGGREDFPAVVHEVRDVTGAGDTVLAVITAALANQLPVSEAAILANRAAGLAVQRFGCARITLQEVANSPALV